jgi:hypothetical protein
MVCVPGCGWDSDFNGSCICTQGFIVCLLIGVGFYALAFFVGLPVIVFRPVKFALSATLGSIFTMVRAWTAPSFRIGVVRHPLMLQRDLTYMSWRHGTGELLGIGGSQGAPAEPHQMVSC